MTTDVVERVRALLAAGQATAARELLLQEGFVRRQDPGLQSAFAELIPPSPSSAERLDTLREALARPDAAARHAALGALSREVFQDFSLHTKEWAADPRFVDVLLRALDDPDPKVVEEAAAILSVVVSRYLADQRAFEPLARLLRSRRKQTRLYAVTGIAPLAHPDRWRALLPAFRDPAREVRHAACRAVVFNWDEADVSAEVRQELAAEVRARLADDDQSTRRMAERAVARLSP